jgi:predicted acyltransferase (DUF342 family)
MKIIVGLGAAALAWMVVSGGQESFADDGRNKSAVNSSVTAEDGSSYGKLSTVNGNVRLGRGASAAEAETVNGSIHFGEDSRAGSASTVNGSLHIGEGVAIERSAETVNGDIEMRRRSRVGGDVATVSGDVELEGAEVTGKIRTTNGDIDLREGAHVRGGILVRKNRGWSLGKDDPIRVTICSTCVVDGELRFERPTELRVEKGAKIGAVIGDEVKRL